MVALLNKKLALFSNAYLNKKRSPLVNAFKIVK